MAKRSHNETFILLRNNAQKNRSFYKDFTKDDERVKLVSAGDDYEEDGDVCDLEISNYSDKSAANGGSAVNGYRDDASAAYPSWIASLDEFRYDAFNIKEKIEQLRKTQTEHLKKQNTAIFADDVTSGRLRDYELDIERRCQELNVLFGRLHSILKHFQTLKGRYAAAAAAATDGGGGGGGGNRMISVILRNIFQFQVQEVVQLTQLFRSCQRVYLERMTDATRVDPQFVITFDEDLLKEELLLDSHDFGSSSNSSSGIRLMSDDSVFFEQGTSHQQQQQQQQQQLQKQAQLPMDDQLALDAQHNAHLRERQAEMNAILKSFAELNTLFQEVNTLVVDQGSALDRIDYNIEQVEHRVELGAVSLEKAHRTITRMRKFKVILGSGLLLFVILLFIIMRS